MSNKIEYITTAIVYPNNRIHLGWGWECVGADWLVRAHQAMGRATRFATGMDEHALKVQKAAEAKGMTPKAHCDEMAGDIRKVLDQLGIGYDRFIRTSDEDHERVVQALVQRAFDNGDIYKAKYEGHYCEGCEAYYLDKDLVDGKCPHHKTTPKWISEENYFFRLEKYQAKLLQLFRDRPDFLQPDHRRAEVVNFIEAGLKDFSISRSNFTWGIPLPFDPKHIIYVWFDALINYLTAAGFDPAQADGGADFKKIWPASVHIIGKDISRFHTIYWPAMLMSLGIELPKKVFAHGFLNIRGDRMSKSSGNIVAPDDVMAVTGPDPLRYYLLAENQFSQDGNFAWDLMALKVNADLANDFGNLVNRTLNMKRKYFPDETLSVAGAAHSAAVVASFETLKADLERAVGEVNPSAYIKSCLERSRVLNLFIDQMKPWALAKKLADGPDAPETKQLREVLYALMEGIRWIASAMMPALPFGMPEVFKQLNVPAPAPLGAVSGLRWGEGRYHPGEPKPIYPRIELPKELLE